MHIAHAALPVGEVLPQAIAIAAAAGGKDRATLQVIKRRMYGETIDLLSTSMGTATQE